MLVEVFLDAERIQKYHVLIMFMLLSMLLTKLCIFENQCCQFCNNTEMKCGQ